MSGLTIPFPGVSRTHAEVHRTPRGLLLRDLASKNKLVIEGRRVEEVELVPGGLVQIGRATLSLEHAHTSDVELAFSLRNHAPEDNSDTGTGSRTPTGSAAEAFQLVRRFESLSHRSFVRGLQGHLDAARRTMGARTLIIGVRTPDGETAVRAISGELPDAPALATAGLPHRPRHLMTVRRSRGRIESTLGREWLLALFGEREEEDWCLDFLDYFARKCFARDAADEPPLLPTGGEIPIPESMVIGDSPRVQEILRQIRSTAASNLDVLLTGETGTGKELFARLIHNAGPTAAGPFVAINCAAIPDELLEAELFGVHGRVATGVDPRPGRFSQAEGGSLFLDEVGEMPQRLQAKLLRVLQEREILPLGAAGPRPIRVRVIAASNRDILHLTENRRFRADLYYRLSALRFDLPPLRERREDIPAFVLAFAREAAAQHRKPIAGVSRSALAALLAYAWPGNIRQLRNEVHRAVLLCEREGTLQPRHLEIPALPPAVTEGSEAGLTRKAESLRDQLEATEREAIVTALSGCKGNRSRAAQVLGITRNGLTLKLRRLGIRF